jgi:hypothetical protein
MAQKKAMGKRQMKRTKGGVLIGLSQPGFVKMISPLAGASSARSTIWSSPPAESHGAASRRGAAPFSFSSPQFAGVRTRLIR